MNDPEDIKLKAEIEKIMTDVHNIIKKIESVDPDKDCDAGKDED